MSGTNRRGHGLLYVRNRNKSLISSASTMGVTLETKKKIENGLRAPIAIQGNPPETSNIIDEMQKYGVPAVSIAVFDSSGVVSTMAYGLTEVDTQMPIMPQTLFQAGSISKPITALGVMRLVELGLLDLDADVNKYLPANWKIPENEFTKIEKVTLRRLLSHTAGLTQGGFPGYEQGKPMPANILEVLEGKGNTPSVVVDAVPGSISRYSGGGTSVVQLIIEEVVHKEFSLSYAEWMKKEVLNKLGMHDSTFEPTPEQLKTAASGHNLDGTVVPGGWHLYPELAAAGLWTTAADLAKSVIAIQKSLQGKDDAFISQSMAVDMLTPQKFGSSQQEGLFGLGPQVDTKDGSLVFDHAGVDRGFVAHWYGLADGRGVVIMTNSQTAKPLIDEVMASVADAHGWPHLQAIEMKTVTPTPKDYPSFEGVYETGGPIPFKFICSGDKLFMHPFPEMKPIELFQDGEGSFFSKDRKTVKFDIDSNTKQVKSVTIDNTPVVTGKNPMFFEKRPLVKPTPEIYLTLEGRYQKPDGQPIEVFCKDDKLFMQSNRDEPVELVQDGATAFHSKDGKVIDFNFDKPGQVRSVTITDKADMRPVTTEKQASSLTSRLILS